MEHARRGDRGGGRHRRRRHHLRPDRTGPLQGHPGHPPPEARRRDRGLQQGPRRRPRLRLARAHRRRAGHREIDAHAPGGPGDGRGRRLGALRFGRGVPGADQAPGGPAGRPRRPALPPGRDQPRAHPGPGRAPGAQDPGRRFDPDRLLGQDDLGARHDQPGPGSGQPDLPLRQDPADPDLPRRPHHQGRARSPGRSRSSTSSTSSSSSRGNGTTATASSGP